MPDIAMSRNSLSEIYDGFQTLLDRRILSEEDRYYWELLTSERARRLLQVLDERTAHITLVMESVDDGHNQAAVLRSCDAFGIQNIHVVSGEAGFSPSPGVSKGTDKWLDIHRHQNMKEAVRELKKTGYRVWASRMDQVSNSINDLDLSRPVAFIFGNEHEGVSNEAFSLADGTFNIPMSGFVESLNISVAAALTIYTTITRTRKEYPELFSLLDLEKSHILKRWIRSSSKVSRRYESVTE